MSLKSATKKSRFINTLCSNCSENYGVPEFREHTLGVDTLTCEHCGMVHKIKSLEGQWKGLYVLEKIKDGGRRTEPPI